MNMSVDDLRRAREENANVSFMDFDKHIRENKDGLFCFFEGKDSPYYRLRITQIWEENYYPITCLGKKKVKKVYELIKYHIEYNKYKKCFFVDSDFDPPLGISEIYETPCYSIENLYTGVAIFSEILKSECQFSETNDDFRRCVSLYQELQNSFHNAMLLFNAWYACLIDQKHISKQETGASLGDKMPKFVKISLDLVEADYNLSSLRARYPDALTVTDETVAQKMELFEQQNKGCIFRGKYELKFMLKIIEDLIEDSKNAKKIVTTPINYSINHAQALSQFSQYAQTPACLLEYIRTVIQ